jgi:Mrp family chromosome partitioning ATPase
MGRMLDALRRTEARRDGGEAIGEPAADDFVSDTTGDEVPFIEVGPARSLEASAAVLAARPPRLRIAPPPADAGPILDPVPACPAVGVCLRPLPDGPELPPQQRFAAEIITLHHPDHPAGAEYRQLAAALLEGTSPEPSRVLLCAGVSPGAGTTSVVLNLAVCFAGTGQRVVVVDAAEARPAVAERLGLCDRPGLTEVLAGDESLDSALQETGLERLTALTAGRMEERSTSALGEVGRPVLRLLRDRFDVVLIDGGTDATGLGRACDLVYLVTPQTEADAPATAERVRSLLRKGTPLRGCIVTGR